MPAVDSKYRLADRYERSWTMSDEDRPQFMTTEIDIPSGCSHSPIQGILRTRTGEGLGPAPAEYKGDKVTTKSVSVNKRRHVPQNDAWLEGTALFPLAARSVGAHQVRRVPLVAFPLSGVQLTAVADMTCVWVSARGSR